MCWAAAWWPTEAPCYAMLCYLTTRGVKATEVASIFMPPLDMSAFVGKPTSFSATAKLSWSATIPQT